jgi:flagellar export protein FliJ
MKVSKIHQDHAQATLHERLAEDHLAKQKLHVCQQALDDSSELADRKHLETQCAAELLQHRMYLNHLVKEVDQQKNVCILTEKEVDKARDILIEANRRTKTMENLKTKQFNNYRQDMLRQEQVVLDEMGLRKKNKI